MCAVRRSGTKHCCMRNNGCGRMIRFFIMVFAFSLEDPKGFFLGIARSIFSLRTTVEFFIEQMWAMPSKGRCNKNWRFVPIWSTTAAMSLFSDWRRQSFILFRVIESHGDLWTSTASCTPMERVWYAPTYKKDVHTL